MIFIDVFHLFTSTLAWVYAVSIPQHYTSQVRDRHVEELQAEVKAKNEHIAEKDDLIAAKDDQIATKDDVITRMDKMIVTNQTQMEV